MDPSIPTEANCLFALIKKWQNNQQGSLVSHLHMCWLTIFYLFCQKKKRKKDTEKKNEDMMDSLLWKITAGNVNVTYNYF